MIKNILVPLDGTTLAEEALCEARRLAKPTCATIHVVRVVNDEREFAERALLGGTLSPYYMRQTDGQPCLHKEDLVSSYLHGMTVAYARAGESIASYVRYGDPADEIVAAAGETSADLIIMMTHGRAGFARWALGSVTEKVLRQAPCPVLALRHSQSIDNILVTLDGTPLAERILEPALALAKLLDVKVTLLRVENVINRVDRWTLEAAAELEQIEPGLGEQYLVDCANESETYIRSMADRFAFSGVEVQAACANGEAANAILAFAGATGSTLIAMSTHGRTGPRRWVYGSVTEKVLRAYRGPLLALRATEATLPA